MAPIHSHVPFSPQRPFRTVRPASDKIIFLSFEGEVTETEYFERVSFLFDAIKNKIHVISVTEDAVNTDPKYRTPEQIKLLSSGRPKQLVERIDRFKQNYGDEYEFDKHPNDEFWIVTDVDDNWSDLWIDEWNEAVNLCAERHYQYVISNPFFEIWLLLHHDDATDEDKAFAVTDEHSYKPTAHFRGRLRKLGAPLKKTKHIRKEDYSIENIRSATDRAKNLHVDKADPAPHYFASTVYLLTEKLFALLDEYQDPTVYNT